MKKPQLITVRITRAEFLKLPISARRRILAQQADRFLRRLLQQEILRRHNAAASGQKRGTR